MTEPRDFDRRRRDWLRILMGAGAMATATGALPVISRPAWAAAERAKEGLYRVSGRVHVNGKPVQKGDLVQPGDRVSTGDDGTAVVVMGEHAFLIHENTEVGLFGGVADQVLEIIAGRMLSVFGEGQLDITTPVATIGIRGTAVYVENEDDRTYACVCYGRANLSSSVTGETLERVATRYHDSPRYIYKPGKEKQIEKAPVINHTDSELIMLEWLHLRRPPFYDNLERGERGGY